MMIYNRFNFALRIISKRPLRSFLTMFQIALGLALVAVFFNLFFLMSKEVENAEDTSLNIAWVSYNPQQQRDDRTFYEPFTLSDYQKVKDSGLFKEITQMEQRQNIGLEHRGEHFGLFSLVYGDEGLPAIFDFKLLAGDYPSIEDIEQRRYVAAIHQEVARQLFGGIEIAVGQKLRFEYALDHLASFNVEGGREFEIIGVYNHLPPAGFDASQVYYAYLPYTTAHQHDLNPYIHQFVVKLPSEMTIMESQEAIEKLLPDFSGMISVHQRWVNPQYYQEMIRSIVLNFGFFGLIALFVAAISLFSIGMVNTVERDREIGLRRALGTTKTGIINQILFESSLLSVLGAIFSIGFTHFFHWLFFAKQNPLFGMPISVPQHIMGTTILFVLGLSLIVGIVFSYYPARLTANMSPAEILKEQ